MDFIYNENDTPRIIAVDGTYIPLSINLKQYGFKTSVNNTYCTGLVSSLFDINKKMLINYRLCKKYNERKALMSQIGYLKPNDILIMDRGYYSKQLLFFLDDNNINPKTAITLPGNHRVEVPAFIFKEHIIWGATAIILSEFVAVIKGFE